MRNLKKILALALALVMSMSLMATANAFTDDDSINDTYETAVTVLSGLKVFQGYDDGSFLPQGAITRAEVAAIIYRIVTGDVADTQVGIYADYNKFDDVASTSWYAGYVNFCANAEYIKGYDARTFGPNDPVTGYQALAMILRALGYDKNGEFTGTNWTIQTAAVGESQGITKNITAGTLNTPATREVVAEILFQAIMVPKATYTPAFGYQTVVNGVENTSLGWDTFKLENVVGVVTANEYADLYDTEAIAEGKTRLDVDGEDYTIDYATDLTNIGMAYDVYLYEGGTVLTIADAGNTVFETGEGTEVNKSNTGMKLDEDVTEYFVNFDNGMQDSAEVAEYFEIEYVQAGTQNGTGVYKTVKYRVGAELDKDDLAVLKASVATLIAKENAEDAGDTYVYKTRDEVELSDGKIYYACEFRYGRNYEEDEINYNSWKGFSNKYLTNDNKIATADVTASDNGEWLKVIDNDADGVADVVLLTEFAMSVISRIARDGEYTLAALDNVDEVAFNDIVKIDGDDVSTEDELAAGDVVIYTLIDGVYYMNLADMVTETVDKKGIDRRAETMTCDGTVYEQSHIGYTDETDYYYDVEQGYTEETYDLYLDHFGYVRLFIESDYSMFMLLTDGYYWTDNRNETLKAMYWDVEADEEVEIDLSNNDADFIDPTNDGHNSDRGTWSRLIEAGEQYLGYTDAKDPFVTDIAGYSVTDDGYDLKSVETSTRRTTYNVQEIEITSKTDLDDEELSSTAASMTISNGNRIDRIQTTTSTQYYLVINDGEKVLDIITWTGYKNVPDEAALAANNAGVHAYAVTHVGDDSNTGADADLNYTIADVVVFETPAYDDHDVYFVFDVNNWRNIEYVLGIGSFDGEIDDERVYVDELKTAVFVNESDLIEFYDIYADGDRAELIGETDANGDPVIPGDYADHDIYAGQVNVRENVTEDDYFQVRGTAAGTLRFNPETTPIYYVVNGSNSAYDVKLVGNDYDEVDNGDRMIVFTDGSSSNNVLYAIWVDGSDFKDNAVALAKIVALYNKIVDDSHPAPVLTIVDNVTNATMSAKVTVNTDGDVSFVVTPDTGYSVPSTVALTLVGANTGATASYDSTTGTVDVYGLTQDATITVAGDAVKNNVTITFDVDGGSAVTALTGNYGDTVTAPADPTKTGYTFAGWDPALPTTFPAANMTVKAQWTENIYDVEIQYVDQAGNRIDTDTLTDRTYTEATADVAKVSTATTAPKFDGYLYDSVTTPTYGANGTAVEVVVTYKNKVSVTMDENADTFSQSAGINFEFSVTPATVSVSGDSVTVTMTRTDATVTWSEARYVTYTVTNANGSGTSVGLTNASGNSATFTILLSNVTDDVVIAITDVSTTAPVTP